MAGERIERAAHLEEGMATFQAEVGRLYWGVFRDLTSRARFNGHKVELWEGRGWLSRQFVFRGDDKIIMRIADLFKQLETINNDPKQADDNG